jgi:hypothetical protein
LIGVIGGGDRGATRKRLGVDVCCREKRGIGWVGREVTRLLVVAVLVRRRISEG